MSIASTSAPPTSGPPTSGPPTSTPPTSTPPTSAPALQAGSAGSALPAVASAGLVVPTVGGPLLDYAPFDHAASTPALVGVQAAVDTAARTYSSVHRGRGWASQVTSAYYEAAREEVARFVGAREDDVVVFTRNTTDALTLLARSLPRATTVFVFGSDHHATLLAWNPRHTVRLPVPASTRDAEALLADALRRTAGVTGPRLVVLTGASNVTGEHWPVADLAAVARAHGARVALDAAQLAPHAPVDLETLGADYVAFSGHKLYAPYGAGVLAGRRDWLDAAPPYLAGGGATAEVSARSVRWETAPARHEGGSPNVLGAVALAAACAALREHRGAVAAHEQRLTTRLVTGLRAIPGVQTYSLFGDDSERAPVVPFTVDGLDSGLVSAALSAEHAIGVRDGRFCAHLLVDALLEDSDHTDSAGAPPVTAVRVSAGLATTDEHVDRLLGAVAALASDGPGTAYEQVDGLGWRPVHSGGPVTVDLPW
ncbi:MAG TPA: aminotransferase class V-fold PLP-dependent enzyme [Dermatophilaceae bacterium]|nr:aminotransferase class V-fold PLP-dependent enzyme [Dermatophilaceae bacterium]